MSINTEYIPTHTTNGQIKPFVNKYVSEHFLDKTAVNVGIRALGSKQALILRRIIKTIDSSPQNKFQEHRNKINPSETPAAVNQRLEYIKSENRAISKAIVDGHIHEEERLLKLLQNWRRDNDAEICKLELFINRQIIPAKAQINLLFPRPRDLGKFKQEKANTLDGIVPQSLCKRIKASQHAALKSLRKEHKQRELAVEVTAMLRDQQTYPKIRRLINKIFTEKIGALLAPMKNKPALFIDLDPDNTDLNNIIVLNSTTASTRLKHQILQLQTRLINSGIIGFCPRNVINCKTGNSNPPQYYIRDHKVRELVTENLDNQALRLDFPESISDLLPMLNQDKSYPNTSFDPLIGEYDDTKKRNHSPGNIPAREEFKLRNNDPSLSEKKTEEHHINSDRSDGKPGNIYLCSREEHDMLHKQLNAIISILIKSGLISFYPGSIKQYQLTENSLPERIKPMYFIDNNYIKSSLKKHDLRQRSLRSRLHH